jgi:hypothetical protein
LILGWSDGFLCLSAFYHYVKIPDTINLKGEIYILSVDFGVFSVSSLGPIAFGPVQGPKVHHGRGIGLPHNQEGKERQELAKSQYPLEGTPSMTF